MVALVGSNSSHSAMQGVLWHWVRGNFQIFAVVDGHVLLSGGPLYSSHAMAIDTKEEWQWVRQDLRKDLSWQEGHLVHVEYAAVEGAVAVAEVVAAVEQPVRPEPGLNAVNQALADASIAWAAAAAKAAVAEADRFSKERQAIDGTTQPAWPAHSSGRLELTDPDSQADLPPSAIPMFKLGISPRIDQPCAVAEA